MKWLKRLGWGLVALLVLGNVWIVASGNAYLYTVFRHTLFKARLGPAIDEYKDFPNREVPAGNHQPWPVSAQYNDRKLPAEHLAYMEEHETVAFLVVRNDSIVFERYWDGYSAHSYSNSFSMAKSVINILIGMAIQDGKIESIDQPVGDFLPQFKGGQNDQLTIRHLLMMSSGINFDESYLNPLAFPARANYGDNVRELIGRYEVTETPGKKFNYQSGNSEILSFIVKAATGKTVSDYASEKLWQPIGAQHPAYWTLDREGGDEKAFCCVNSNARDFARFGKLYLHHGNWNGQQLVDSGFVAESVKAAPLTDFDGGPNERYGLHWWVMDHNSHPVFYARGILGQYVTVIPAENTIVVRLGKKREMVKGDKHPQDLMVYLDAVQQMYW